MKKFYEIDARKLACPKPLILTKKALEEGVKYLKIIVDNEAAFENVSRFIKYSQGTISETSKNDDGYFIFANTGDVENKGALEKSKNKTFATSEKTIFISSDKIGHGGKDDLGSLLMEGFIYTLLETNQLPKTVIMMNAGVTLAVKGSKSSNNLEKLYNKGVDIIVCGTCLEFYNIEKDNIIGKVSNMYDIANFLMQDNVTTVS